MPLPALAFLLAALAPSASAECSAPAVGAAAELCGGGDRPACVATLNTLWAECQTLERRQGLPFPRFKIEGVNTNGANVPGVVLSLRMANGLPTFPELSARSSGVERDAAHWTSRADNGRAYNAAFQRCRAQGSPSCGEAPASPEHSASASPEPRRDDARASPEPDREPPAPRETPASREPSADREPAVAPLSAVRFDAERPVVGDKGGFPADGSSAGGGGPDRGARQVGEANAALKTAAKDGDGLKADAEGRLASGEGFSGGAGARAADGQAAGGQAAGGSLAAAAATRPDLAASVGLSVAAGPDGKPVLRAASGGEPSTAQLAPLEAMLRAQTHARPAARSSMRFQEPQRYAELKTGYADPRLRASVFKDAALVPEKDEFRWQKDCERVSGACNASAEESYASGDLLSDEELRKMWAEVSVARVDGPSRGGIGGEQRRRSLVDRLFSRVWSSEDRDESGAVGAAAVGSLSREADADVSRIASETIGGITGAGAARAVEAGALPSPAAGRYGFALAVLLTVLGAAVAHFGWLRRES